MAVNLDTRLPLAAVGSPLNPAGVLQNARSNAIQQKLDEMRMDYESRKRRRETDTERYMGEAVNAIRQGRPAQTVTDFQWNTPNQTGVPQSPYEMNVREVAPAVPGRQPTLEDMQAASIDAMFKAGDLQGAFEAMKAARSGQVSQMKPFGGETKIGADGQAYAFNQASGRYEPTGFYPQAAPEKQEKPVRVRTSRGIEFVTPKPGMVLKPPVEPQKTEKPVSAPAPSIDESKNAGFYQRMSSVSEMLNRYERNGKPTEYTSMVGGIPVIGQYLQRGAMTPDQAQYRNAAMAWIRAKLRKESGAVIGDDEAKSEYETYFPLPNDKPEVIEQKRQLRKIAEDEMRLSAGKAVSLVSTSQQKKQEFSALPPASQFFGKIATDQQTGIKYKSDGNQWVRVK